MCDIWKGESTTRQLGEEDVEGLLASLAELRTQWVVLSGGEPLLNPNLFRLCRLLRSSGISRITLLSTGQNLGSTAAQVSEAMDEVIVSLDGTREIHDEIRRVPGAFDNLASGVSALKQLNSEFRVTARCVIQRRNFAQWPEIVRTAKELGLDGISFLAADMTSQAFNRSRPWSERRHSQIAPSAEQLPELAAALEAVTTRWRAELESEFIAESPDKLRRIVAYYTAHHDRGSYPRVRCNAPWVSAVVEADGTVRPCFFHPPYGSVEETGLAELVNSPGAVRFRRELDVGQDPICQRCVCSLHLAPRQRIEPD
jgi:MoaA/NifB/PqqE/SkfB family radical SAM enzyme